MPIAYPDAITTADATRLMSKALGVPISDGDVRCFARWVPGFRVAEGGARQQFLSKKKALELAKTFKDGPLGGNLTGRAGHRRFGANVQHRDAFEAGAEDDLARLFGL